MKRMAVFVMALLVLGCSQEFREPQPSHIGAASGENGGNEQALQEMPAGQKENEREFAITARRFEFSPSTITVNKGDKVKITITSTDVPHGFSIEEYGIDEKLNPNEPVVVEFIADKAGTFTYRCSVPCGAGHAAMSGTLIVRE
jgi:cytochrome c oxidase subunit 2